MQRTPTPLTLGWEAARANAVPALIIPAIMLALLIVEGTSVHTPKHFEQAFAEAIARITYSCGGTAEVIASPSL